MISHTNNDTKIDYLNVKTFLTGIRVDHKFSENLNENIPANTFGKFSV
jgi:hypothetical protein